MEKIIRWELKILNENTTDITPKVVIDISKYRIRIHRTTIKALGNPERVLLLVNPDEKTMGIMSTESDDRKGHKIKYDGLSCEIYSIAFIETLGRLTEIFKVGHRYIIEGNLITKENLVTFKLEKATAFSSELQFVE